MKQQIITMLEMQNAMNEKVHKNWRQQNFAWYRAIWIESAELLDHYGWKWWKQQEPDREQVVLELVDIWHFGLSILLVETSGSADIAEEVEKKLVAGAKGDFRETLESFALQTLKTKAFDVAGFAALMAGADLSFNELYSTYVSKNVLNFFRQDNGYKEGTYTKIWGGKEDNAHLVELVADLDGSRVDFREVLYSGLQTRYAELVK